MSSNMYNNLSTSDWARRTSFFSAGARRPLRTYRIGRQSRRFHLRQNRHRRLPLPALSDRRDGRVEGDLVRFNALPPHAV